MLARQLQRSGKWIVAIALTMLLAIASSIYVLSHERLRWPFQTSYEVNAVFSSVVAVAPGQGEAVNVAGVRVGQIAGASLFADGYRGRARMVVDLDRDVLLGVTFVGSGVGELLHSATVAVAGEVPIDRLWHAVPSYPTMSEIWLRFLETFRG